jgi:4-hydroxybenzoate polyprenyltransferase
MRKVMDHDEKISVAVTKMGVAASGMSYSLTDLPLNELVALATLIFVILQIIYLLIKFWKNATGRGQW